MRKHRPPDQWPRQPFIIDREYPSVGLQALPTEIFLLILRWLPVSARICLALTCKSLMETLFPENILPRLAEEDLIALLSLLQKDIPGAYLCFCCQKLRQLIPGMDWASHDHRWNIGLFQNPTWHITSHTTWHIPAPYYFSSFKDHFYVDFMDAYLVMNSHFLGSSHGLPLESLERYVSFQDHFELHNCQHSTALQDEVNQRFRNPPGLEYRLYERKEEEPPRKKTAWRVSFRMIPKIVDDKLYLARFYTIVGPWVPWSCMARLLSSFSPEICCHLQCSADSRLLFCDLHYGFMQQSNPGAYVSIAPRTRTRQRNSQPPKFDPESGSCQLCSTDYDIILHQNQGNKEWNFRLSTYHCLGSCRSPQEKFWEYLVGNLGEVFVSDLIGFERAQTPVRSQFLESHRGFARQTWQEDNTYVDEVQCRFD
ncbi:uncharacterized protein TRIVIDRAFT_44462 [Trichoderma virens Gv29-8]|uniref:F-box domain-containing protein n=1 Tax=Hypocrea virens (strain Gv29-8 / FGSC 10586) TaxID=413071 RepID=G9N5F1_HYPVG|nr:uncharacterized protein TRIVIDRAFT_44462 [Trichoderma virens Gv29-8]EHK17996.1 hypothetical protein TRIVIDRAFT_44462 [Trichoderma virens Gv29-8]